MKITKFILNIILVATYNTVFAAQQGLPSKATERDDLAQLVVTLCRHDQSKTQLLVNDLKPSEIIGMIEEKCKISHAAANAFVISLQNILKLSGKSIASIMAAEECTWERNAFHYACVLGKEDIVDVLLETDDENQTLLFSRDSDGNTALAYAVEGNNHYIIEKLIATAGEMAPTYLLTCNLGNGSILHRAALYGSVNTLNQLLRHALDKNILWDLLKIKTLLLGETAYHFAENDENAAALLQGAGYYADALLDIKKNVTPTIRDAISECVDSVANQLKSLLLSSNRSNDSFDYELVEQ